MTILPPKASGGLKRKEKSKDDSELKLEFLWKLVRDGPCLASQIQDCSIIESLINDRLMEKKRMLEDSEILWISQAGFKFFESAMQKEIDTENKRANDLTAERDRLREGLGVSNMKEAENEMKTFIEQLHAYNEVKDVTQSLLGKLAESTGTTVSDLYATYDLEQED